MTTLDLLTILLGFGLASSALWLYRLITEEEPDQNKS